MPQYFEGPKLVEGRYYFAKLLGLEGVQVFQARKVDGKDFLGFFTPDANHYFTTDYMSWWTDDSKQIESIVARWEEMDRHEQAKIAKNREERKKKAR